MKAFLLKYKGSFVYWLILAFAIFYFIPAEKGHYLFKDMDHFKDVFLTPVLTWIGIGLSVFGIIFLLKRTGSIRNSLFPWLCMVAVMAGLLFLFQSVFLAGALFLNRQFRQTALQKTYVVDYLAGTDPNKENFLLYDTSEKEISTDYWLINKLYRPGLKRGDTLRLQFEKGWLGIQFLPQGLR